MDRVIEIEGVELIGINNRDLGIDFKILHIRIVDDVFICISNVIVSNCNTKDTSLILPFTHTSTYIIRHFIVCTFRNI